MQNKKRGLLLSPTDLIRFMESPFASWMERLHREVPALATPDPLTEDASTPPNSIKELGLLNTFHQIAFNGYNG
jgi:hypothetical protein